jgi:hypothetical protein
MQILSVSLKDWILKRFFSHVAHEPKPTLKSSEASEILLPMLQKKFANLVGKSSGYFESLPKPVQDRVKALKNLQVSTALFICRHLTTIYRTRNPNWKQITRKSLQLLKKNTETLTFPSTQGYFLVIAEKLTS